MPVDEAVIDAVRRARTGDAQAFRAVYDAHLGRVYAVCLRLTGCRDEAEELTQRVFIRAWERLPGFRGDSAFATWLHRLTLNEAMSNFRSTARRLRRVFNAEDLEAIEPVPARPPAAEPLDLERAIAQLPRGARMVFVLYEIEGYAHEEIAGITGLAIGTSKAQLHRARRLLREALER
jgi:RNA polymerase sigma-70 factor (ECF subfamily)